MENPKIEFQPKQENGAFLNEICSSNRVAMKIYNIEELVDNPDRNCSEYLCVLKAEIDVDNACESYNTTQLMESEDCDDHVSISSGSDINTFIYDDDDDDEDYDDQLIDGKEIVQESKNSGIKELEYENEDDYYHHSSSAKEEGQETSCSYINGMTFLEPDDEYYYDGSSVLKEPAEETNSSHINGMEYGETDEDFYENLTIGKEEVQSSSDDSDIELIDDKLEENDVQSPKGQPAKRENIGNGQPDSRKVYYILLCPFCGKEYANNAEWRTHLNDIHKFNNRENFNLKFSDENTAECRECRITLVVKGQILENLQRHKIRHLPHSRYVICKLCDRDFGSKGQYNRHMRSRHSKKDSNESKDYSRRARSQNKVILLCPFCGLEFNISYDWRNHLNNIHGFNKRENLELEFLDDKTAKCLHCEMTLNTNRLPDLQQHKITHLPYNRYIKCKYCGKLFGQRSPLKCHLERRHNIKEEQPNNFPISNETISSKKNEIPVPTNSAYHGNSPIMLCPFCGIEFMNSIDWRRHVNAVHKFNETETLNMEILGDNKTKCRQCDKVLHSKHHHSLNLQRHKIGHLPFHRYVKCKLCDQLFVDNRSHYQHMNLRHGPGSEEACSIANKDYIRSTSWQIEATLLCPFCGLEFPNSYDWRLHIFGFHKLNKVENLNMDILNETTARCKQCDRIVEAKFHFIWNLQQHKITHLPYNEYIKCKSCHVRYGHKAAFNYHLGRECNKGRVHQNGDFGKSDTKNENPQRDDLPKDSLQTYGQITCPQNTGFQNTSFQNNNIQSLVAGTANIIPQKQKNETLCQKTPFSQTNPIYICPFCGLEFPGPVKWRLHLNVVHKFNKRESLSMEYTGQNSAQCKLCPTILDAKSIFHLQRHTIIHLSYSRFIKCEMCSKCFRNSAAYKRHLERRL